MKSRGTRKLETIPLFPLNTVLFPGMLLPLHIFEERYKQMIGDCMARSKPFGVVLMKSGQAEGPLQGELHTIGTTARVARAAQLSDGRMNIMTIGQQRFRIIELHPHQKPYLMATIEHFPLTTSDTTTSIANQVATRLTHYLSKFKKLGKVRVNLNQFPSDPQTLAYLTGVVLPVESQQKQKILSMESAAAMLEYEHRLLRHELTILDILLNERPTESDPFIPFSLN